MSNTKTQNGRQRRQTRQAAAQATTTTATTTKPTATVWLVEITTATGPGYTGKHSAATAEAAIKAGLRSSKIADPEAKATATATDKDATKNKATRPYDAKHTGHLTDKNGLERSAWAGSEIVTGKERDICEGLANFKFAHGSDPTTAELAAHIGYTANQVAGAVSVLIAKGRVAIDRRVVDSNTGRKANLVVPGTRPLA